VDIFRPVKTTGSPYELGLGENLWPETPGDFRAIAEKYIANLIFLATYRGPEGARCHAHRRLHFAYCSQYLTPQNHEIII